MEHWLTCHVPHNRRCRGRTLWENDHRCHVPHKTFCIEVQSLLVKIPIVKTAGKLRENTADDLKVRKRSGLSVVSIKSNICIARE
jgi:hypothetical protein